MNSTAPILSLVAPPIESGDLWGRIEAKYETDVPDILEIDVIDCWMARRAGWLPNGHALFEHRRNSGRKGHGSRHED